ncbi:MAG: hypothetical protein LBV60_03005 [Streptomyces sp.]|jgi:hypothetical protein|nr:hypothetical protein [Streptomyces sp.]
MTGIGPVEPAEPQAPPPHPESELLTSGAPDRLTPREYWQSLPPRARRTGVALAAVGAAASLLVLQPSPPPAAVSSPYPTQTTFLHYRGKGRESDSYRFLLRVESGTPVTVSRLRLPFAEFETRTTPRLPLTVNAGTPAPLTVRIRVRHCSTPPRTIDLPHLDLTLRNRRALQQHSFLFGGAFPHDLARELSAACPIGRTRTDLTRP